MASRGEGARWLVLAGCCILTLSAAGVLAQSSCSRSGDCPGATNFCFPQGTGANHCCTISPNATAPKCTLASDCAKGSSCMFASTSAKGSCLPVCSTDADCPGSTGEVCLDGFFCGVASGQCGASPASTTFTPVPTTPLSTSGECVVDNDCTSTAYGHCINGSCCALIVPATSTTCSSMGSCTPGSVCASSTNGNRICLEMCSTGSCSSAGLYCGKVHSVNVTVCTIKECRASPASSSFSPVPTTTASTSGECVVDSDCSSSKYSKCIGGTCCQITAPSNSVSCTGSCGAGSLCATSTTGNGWCLKTCTTNCTGGLYCAAISSLGGRKACVEKACKASNTATKTPVPTVAAANTSTAGCSSDLECINPAYTFCVANTSTMSGSCCSVSAPHTAAACTSTSSCPGGSTCVLEQGFTSGRCLQSCSKVSNCSVAGTNCVVLTNGTQSLAYCLATECEARANITAAPALVAGTTPRATTAVPGSSPAPSSSVPGLSSTPASTASSNPFVSTSSATTTATYPGLLLALVLLTATFVAYEARPPAPVRPL